MYAFATTMMMQDVVCSDVQCHAVRLPWQLSVQLRYFIRKKQQEDKLWQNMRVIFRCAGVGMPSQCCLTAVEPSG